MKYLHLLFFCFLFLLTSSGYQLMAQAGFTNWVKQKPDFSIDPFAMVQLWSSYSTGQQVYNEETGAYEAVDNRFNAQLRRARLGFKMQPYENLKFTVVAAYDLLGRDALSGTSGGANNSSPGSFGIWDAFVQWRIKPGSEAFHLTGGYFRPQLSRESITSGWSVNSMEKAHSQSYIRKHLVGQGPGRAAGLNIGGLLLNDAQNVGFNYNLGVFNPNYIAANGNSVGEKFAPLLVGRAVLYLGDPEMTTYKIGYDINYYGNRKGLSVAVAGSWQDETELFEAAYTLSSDLLFNWGHWNVDADYNFMWREGDRIEADHNRAFSYRSEAGHFRAGYNLVAKDKFFLEPTLMLMQFKGGMTATEQADAEAVGAYAGEDYAYDAGINWYLNKKHLKLMLHYTWREGEAGAAEAGTDINYFYYQKNVGAIQRGNWWGLGLNAIF